MTSHLDVLTPKLIFFNSVTHLRTSAKTDYSGPPNVTSSKYNTFISDDSDDATFVDCYRKENGTKGIAIFVDSSRADRVAGPGNGRWGAVGKIGLTGDGRQ